MTEDLEGLLIAALFVVPPFLVAVLRRTRLFWVPGVAVIVLGFVALGSITESDGDVGGINAWATGMMTIAGVGLLMYGGILLVAGAWGRPRSQPPVQPPPRVELPPAIVVNDTSKT